MKMSWGIELWVSIFSNYSIYYLLFYIFLCLNSNLQAAIFFYCYYNVNLATDPENSM